MGILEVRGTLSVSQFWPEGSSDADTNKVLVKPGPGQVRYAGRPTRVIERAVVKPSLRAAAGKPGLNKRGELTIRLQGVDAPELHYRPILQNLPDDARTRLAKVNALFRQHVAESATVALKDFLVRVGGGSPVACRVRTAVKRPSDVFDVYGRFVGDVQVRIAGRWTSVNEWLVAHGWAFPALYESMSRREIGRMRSLASSARRRKAGVWAHYTTDADRFDRGLVFRGHGASMRSDRGLVSLPKMFRRASTWGVLQLARVSSESFAEHLHGRGDDCFLTREFLRGRREKRRLECFLSDHGRMRVEPADLVFCERGSVVVDGKGVEIGRW